MCRLRVQSHHRIPVLTTGADGLQGRATALRVRGDGAARRPGRRHDDLNRRIAQPGSRCCLPWMLLMQPTVVGLEIDGF